MKITMSILSLLIAFLLGMESGFSWDDHRRPKVDCQGAISAAGPTTIRNGKIIIEARESGVIYFPKGCKP